MMLLVGCCDGGRLRETGVWRTAEKSLPLMLAAATGILRAGGGGQLRGTAACSALKSRVWSRGHAPCPLVVVPPKSAAHTAGASPARLLDGALVCPKRAGGRTRGGWWRWPLMSRYGARREGDERGAQRWRVTRDSRGGTQHWAGCRVRPWVLVFRRPVAIAGGGPIRGGQTLAPMAEFLFVRDSRYE